MTFNFKEPKTPEEKNQIVRDAMGQKKKPRFKFHVEHDGEKITVKSGIDSGKMDEQTFDHSNHAAQHIMGLMKAGDAD